MKCSDCSLKNATVKLPSTLKALCKECFYAAVELNGKESDDFLCFPMRFTRDITQESNLSS